MIKCEDDCTPCCDFCIHAINDIFELDGRTVTGGPIGCFYHKDKKHQDIAEACGYCDDFHCFLANKE